MLASTLATALREGALASIGYKKTADKCSMKSKSLPRHILEELRLKRQLEETWKSLSSAIGPDEASVSAAEEAFVEQSAKVEGIFKHHRNIDRNKIRLACLGKTPAAKKQFWGAVTGKVKQSSDISAVLTTAGVLKCGCNEIAEEVEKHFCDVFDGSMESLVPATPVAEAPDDHSYSSSLYPPNKKSDHSYANDSTPRLPRVGVSDDLDKNPSNWLAKDFTSKELKLIAASLSNGKARGWDNLPSEFIKYAPDLAFDILALLFNKIKGSGTFPKGWNCGRITLIHKKGLRAKLGNYRPITVLISLSGFFSKVMNERLIEIVESYNILGEAQNGFRKERCGADNIFVLHTIMRKAKAIGVKIHLGFVDIQKAYDSVNRAILWKKLESLGIGGDFLRILKSMYFDDSVRCTVNGVTTRPVFLQRGLRQGCSLSPILFALYIMEIGEDLSASGEGFRVGNVVISGLLFADDIVLVSRTAAGLRRLFHLVKSRCDALLLVINTGEGKSEVVSPTDDVWEIFDAHGNLDLSLRQVLKYTYLGLDTTSSILRTTMSKQAKCISVANSYKFACLNLGQRGPDVVDVSLATWVNIALPTILFGCESIIFKETNILAVERIQSQVAKSILGVPSNTANICAQTELRLFSFRHLLYKTQLKFYFRVLDLPCTRWVKQAMLDHLSLSWQSPYLAFITSIRENVMLPFVPPTMRYLKIHLVQWSLSVTNHAISSRLSNAGLGNRHPRFAMPAGSRKKTCPFCPRSKLTEGHVVFFCSAMERYRKELDLTLFRTICRSKGFSEEETFSLFVNGYDWNETIVPDTDFPARGLAMDTVRGHWLSL